MLRYLEIDQCLDCPFFDWDIGRYMVICLKTGTRTRHIDPIPNDCPLPYAPSVSPKAEVAQCGMSIQECIDAIDKAIDIKAEHLKAIYEDMLAAMSGIKNDKASKAQNCPKCGKHGDAQEFYSGGGYKAYTCNGCKTVWPVGINE